MLFSGRLSIIASAYLSVTSAAIIAVFSGNQNPVWPRSMERKNIRLLDRTQLRLKPGPCSTLIRRPVMHLVSREDKRLHGRKAYRTQICVEPFSVRLINSLSQALATCGIQSCRSAYYARSTKKCEGHSEIPFSHEFTYRLWVKGMRDHLGGFVLWHISDRAPGPSFIC